MKVGVIGSGSIGPDLAYGFLSALSKDPSSKVYLLDIKQEALDQGVARIKGYVKKGIARGKITAKAAKALEDALVPTLRMEDLAECAYVLEAASEDLGVKRRILHQLESVVPADCLIGFATSGLPRAQIAAEAKHPARCFVNHPFFPAWRSLPIEVVSSGDPTFEPKMISMLECLGKVPISTADVACFAADDIFCNYISEAARIVEDGVASPAQVDKIVNDAIGGGGPFNVMDATRGNLLTVHCQELMKAAPTGSAWFDPPKSLSTQGNRPWHDRTAPGDGRYDDATKTKVLDRILAVLVARTYFVLDHGICEATELNWLTRMALGFSKGLLELAGDLGADRCLELCTTYAAKNPGFETPRSIAEKRLATFDVNVKVQLTDGIGVVRVFRPEVKNALSAQTVKEVARAIETLAADTSVKGIVLTSTDGALAGADINELAVLPNPEACEKLCLGTHPLFERISKTPKPIVAAVNGPVMGGGAELSMACHARVVGPELMFSQPEVNLGIIPGYGGTQRLPRLIGFDKALDMMRTGKIAGAKEACAWGWAYGEPSRDPVKAATDLVLKAVRGEVKLSSVDNAPMQVPSQIQKSDIGHRSLAIDAILVDVVKKGLAMPLSEGLAYEAKGFGRCRATVDMDIGMKNFIQNGPRVPAAFLNE